MNLKVLIIFAATLFPSLSMSQTEQNVNQTDKNGKKQGHWIKKYPEGNVLYDGYFRDDKPYGAFKRYYEDNTLKSDLAYSENGTVANASLYYPNGLLASRGRYIRQLKEGKWKFYSPSASGVIISEEEYLHDKKNGFSLKYYPDSTIAEKLTYKNDLKEGEWLKYYPDGSVNLRTNYRDNMLNGSFEAYFENGQPEMTGNYRDDLRDGAWTIYFKDGRIRFKIKYTLGIANNRDMEIYETNYVDSLEKNTVKIADPEKTGQIW
jgi:antitoxin component YwqK of YwqJK toxin-antitoxin module